MSTPQILGLLKKLPVLSVSPSSNLIGFLRPNSHPPLHFYLLRPSAEKSQRAQGRFQHCLNCSNQTIVAQPFHSPNDFFLIGSSAHGEVLHHPVDNENGGVILLITLCKSVAEVFYNGRFEHLQSDFQHFPQDLCAPTSAPRPFLEKILGSLQEVVSALCVSLIKPRLDDLVPPFLTCPLTLKCPF
jgi:hypothetical protein